MVKKVRVTPRCGALAAALIFGASVGFTLSAPANASKVGVAAAVNPDAFSSLSGVPNKQLNIGKSIFYNERIKTSAQGLVQVLLVDGSTFTVGPNSNLTIDRFVYDPNKKTGEIVATFSKGSMRFIGGKLSKNDGGVKVNTPSGVLAIRGGMFQGHTHKKIYSFLFGHSMTLQGRNGKVHTVYQPGYTLDLSQGGGTVRPTTAEDTNVFTQALSSPATNTASANGGDNAGASNPGSAAQQTGQQAANIANTSSQAVADATFTQIQAEITKQLVRLEQLRSDPVAPPKFVPLPVPSTQEPDSPDVPTVVKDGGVFDGFATGFIQTGTNGSGAPEFLVNGTSHVELDPDADSVSATIRATHVDGLLLPKTTAYTLGFGGQSPSGYNDDYDFQALADNGTSSVVRSQVVLTGPWWRPRLDTEVTTYNGANLSHTSPEPAGGLTSLSNAPLCTDCEFMKYGTWASDVSYGTTIDKMGGWWIATDDPVKSAGDLPDRGNAYYAGNAVGTFARRIDDAWTQDVGATGDLALDWNFRKRKGDLRITDFGTERLGYKSFRSTVRSPGDAIGFAGALHGSGGIGATRGTFVGPNAGAAPRGVIGDFGITGGNWKANGVYGASHVPNIVSDIQR